MTPDRSKIEAMDELHFSLKLDPSHVTTVRTADLAMALAYLHRTAPDAVHINELQRLEGAICRALQ